MEIDSLRFLMAFFVGVFLTLSGSLAQNTTENSLASPSTLGFDGLAVLCVLIGQGLIIFFDLNIKLSLASFCLFNLFFFLSLYLFKERKKNLNSLDMKLILLIGIAFNLFVGAIFSIVQFFFMSLSLNFPTGLWFGSFKFFSQFQLPILVVVYIILIIFLLKNLSSLRLISIGSSFARGVGVNIKQTQRVSLFFSLYLTGVVICFFGVFSFISLIIPHILRLMPLIKRDMRKELIIGPILGGLILGILDIFIFNYTIYGAELPVGMISSVLGSFVLIFLLAQNYYKSLQN